MAKNSIIRSLPGSFESAASVNGQLDELWLYGLPLDYYTKLPAQIEGVTAKDGTLCGILIDPNDHATLAFEIRRLLDDNLYYLEWAKRSAHLAESSRFDAMLAAYEEVLRDSDASNTNDLPTKTSAGISVLGK